MYQNMPGNIFKRQNRMQTPKQLKNDGADPVFPLATSTPCSFQGFPSRLCPEGARQGLSRLPQCPTDALGGGVGVP